MQDQPQAQNYPTTAQRDASGEDPRFTVGMALGVSRVIERNGYPEFSAPDFTRLQASLRQFLYGPEGANR